MNGLLFAIVRMNYEDFIAALGEIANKKYGSALTTIDSFRKLIVEVCERVCVHVGFFEVEMWTAVPGSSL